MIVFDGLLAARVPLSAITTLSSYPVRGERGEVTIGNNGKVSTAELIRDDFRISGGCPGNWFGKGKQGGLLAWQEWSSPRALARVPRGHPAPVRVPSRGQALPQVHVAIGCESACPCATWPPLPRVYVANPRGCLLSRLTTTHKSSLRRIERLPPCHVSEPSACTPISDGFANLRCRGGRSFARSTATKRQSKKVVNGRCPGVPGVPGVPFPSNAYSPNHTQQWRYDRAFFNQRAASLSPLPSPTSPYSPGSSSSSSSSSLRLVASSSSSSSSSASDDADAGTDSMQSSPAVNGNRTEERGLEGASSQADGMQGVQLGRAGSGGGGEAINRPDEKGGLRMTSQSAAAAEKGKEKQVRKDDLATPSSSSSSSSSPSIDGTRSSEGSASAMAAQQQQQQNPRSVEEGTRTTRESPSLTGGQSDSDGDGSLQQGSFIKRERERGRGRGRGDHDKKNNFKSSNTETRPSGGGKEAAMLSPTRVITWGGRLPSKRRAVLGSILALSVAIGGNLAGITSAILSFDEDITRHLRLDTLYPVKGLRRCIDRSRGFEFVYPARWLGDQRLLYRAVERADAVLSLDPPSLKAAARERKRRQRSRQDPVVAFGPPRGSGEENVSVVVSPVPMAFSLEQFGSPTSVGRRLLDRLLATTQQKASSSKGGGGGRGGGGGGGGGEGGEESLGRKEAELIYAGERVVGPRGTRGVSYYDLEYTVKTDQWFRHNRAVFACVDGRLYSLNAQTPQTSWPKRSQMFETIARSFRVFPSSFSYINE